jgi:hypothetical protein
LTKNNLKLTPGPVPEVEGALAVAGQRAAREGPVRGRGRLEAGAGVGQGAREAQEEGEGQGAAE